MSEEFTDKPIPRAAILGAAALIGFALLAVAVTRYQAEPVTVAERIPETRLALRVEDRADGGVAILDHASGAPLLIVESGAHGFVRGVFRALARARRLSDIGADEPFYLYRDARGRVTLADAQTGRFVDLAAFGVTNVAPFEALLAAAPELTTANLTAGERSTD